MLGWILASRCVRAFGRALLRRAAGALPPAALIVGSLAQGCSIDRASMAGGDGGFLDDGSLDSTEEAFLTDDGSACHPGDVTTYVSGAYHPAAATYQGVCSDVQRQGFYDACLGSKASTDTCNAFSQADAGNAACASCILTPETATAYGPLVEHGHGTFITENVGGCIELVDPSSLPCAKEQQALLGCQLAACEANCPVHDVATRAAYDGCAAMAGAAGCQAYATRAACAQDGGASATCVGRTFKAFYDDVVPRFCGMPEAGAAPPHDAGPSDATTADASPTDGAAADAAVDATVDAATEAAATDAPAADARSDAASSD